MKEQAGFPSNIIKRHIPGSYLLRDGKIIANSEAVPHYICDAVTGDLDEEDCARLKAGISVFEEPLRDFSVGVFAERSKYNKAGFVS